MTYDFSVSPLCIMNLMNFTRSLNGKAYHLVSSENITLTQYGTIVIDIYDKKDNNLSIEVGDTLIGYFIKEDGEYTGFCKGVELAALDWSILNRFIENA